MNPALLLDLILAFGLSFFTAQNDDAMAGVIRKIKAAKDSGLNVDRHMAAVAAALLNDEPMDWDSLNAEIDAEVDEFLGVTEPEPEPEPQVDLSEDHGGPDPGPESEPNVPDPGADDETLPA